MSETDDSTKCDHDRSEVMVTNQPGGYDRTRSHASSWVCADPLCVVDAIGWVMRFTKEPAWWKRGVDGEWQNTIPSFETGEDQ